MHKTILLFTCLVLLPARATLHWQNCHDAPFYLDQDATASQQCALLEVPLAYDADNQRARRNETRTLTLALTKLSAHGKALGNLIIISGGPGQPGVAPYYDGDDPGLEHLRQHFDIIQYDPRGVGLSRPQIRCHDDSDESAATLLNLNAQDFVAGCMAHTPAHLLAHIGSHEAANDVERIRRALGDAPVNLLAYSYGTKIAALYALRFPEQLRAAVLDGVVDIFENDFSIRLHQEKGYQHAYRAFRDYCLQTPGCPLAAHPAESSASLEPLIWQSHLLRQYEQTRRNNWQNRLTQNTGQLFAILAATVSGNVRHLDDSGNDNTIPDTDTITSILYNELLWSEYWPDLDYALRDFMYGDPSYLEYLSLMQDDSFDALTAINCADSALALSDGENRIRQRYINNASPYDNLALPGIKTELDPCGLWPYPGGDYRYPPPAQAPATLPRLLFMAQRHDPATPWHNARRMAEYFHAPLITRDGHGHTLVFSELSACMDDIALAYLLDPEQALADSTCPADTPQPLE